MLPAPGAGCPAFLEATDNGYGKGYRHGLSLSVDKESVRFRRTGNGDYRVITVVIAHRQAVIRRGIRSILQEDTDCEVVGETDARDVLLDMCRRLEPNVLLLEASSQQSVCVEVAASVWDVSPGSRVLLVALGPPNWSPMDTVRAGLGGCVVMNGDGERDILRAVSVVANGGIWLGQDPTIGNHDPNPRFRLTNREHEVLSLMAQMLSNAEIAEQLNLSKYTIKNHVASICRKLGASGRVSAVLVAIDSGLVSLNHAPVRGPR